jgi:AAA+ superfamily predicted ATPase
MGFLATAEVVECSVKDMVGEYVGHTGPKTQKLIESALGKVLFIDEAYRLGEDRFAREAADELVDCITKPRFLNKQVIILAGYDNQINEMLDANPGLSSRFAESVNFNTLSGKDCFQLLQLQLEKRKQLDTTQISTPSEEFRLNAIAKFENLAARGNFANGRDVETSSKEVARSILKAKRPAGQPLTVTDALVIDKIDEMITERAWRAKTSGLPIRHTAALPSQCDRHPFGSKS